MKCKYCGYEIPEGLLYCEQCGKELCIVPEYNPLEDMLTAQIKVAINEESEQTTEYGDNYLFSDTGRNTTGRRTASMNRNTGRNTGRTAGRDTGRNTGRNTGRTTGRSTTGRMPAEKEKRRQAERKRALRKKRRNIVLLILVIFIVLVVGAGIFIYQNSYTGIVRKGQKASQNKEYESAESFFKKAMAKNNKKGEAYEGLSNIYIAQNDLTKAEELFSGAIESQPSNIDIYEAFIQYYMDTDQKAEIPLLLDDANEKVTDALESYIIEQPSFSLEEEETFDDVTQLDLEVKSKNLTIYYTMDGKTPTTASTKYSEPIQILEGSSEITAIAVNKNGVPSLPVKKTYQVEFPIEDAPAVAPSTGQYNKPMKIEIKVPEGYTAYYTTDKSDPTTASTQYTEPIDMPAGETLFKAILVNAKGKTSGITTRNYLQE